MQLLEFVELPLVPFELPGVLAGLLHQHFIFFLQLLVLPFEVPQHLLTLGFGLPVVVLSIAVLFVE